MFVPCPCPWWLANYGPERELGKARDHEDYEGADHVGILHTMAFVGKGEKRSLRMVYAHYGIPRVRETAFTPAHDGSPHAAGFSAS